MRARGLAIEIYEEFGDSFEVRRVAGMEKGVYVLRLTRVNRVQYIERVQVSFKQRSCQTNGQEDIWLPSRF